MDFVITSKAITWVIIGQCILLCAFLLTRKKNNYRNIRFAGFISCICIEYSAWVFDPLFSSFILNPSIMMAPFAFMVGPFLYLSAYSFREEKNTYTYLHFIPAGMATIALIIYGLLSTTPPKQFNFQAMYITIYSHQLIYVLLTLYQDKRTTNGKTTWNTGLYPWVWQLSFIMIVMLAIDFTFTCYMISGGTLFYTTLMLLEIYLFLFSFKIMGSLSQSTPRPTIGKYLKSSLDKDTADIFSKAIEDAMTKEKLYLEPGLGLATLADHLGMATHHVSEILNTCIGMKFYDYVNYWRVQHATELLSNTDLSVLDIAMQSGFNNKVSFHKAFRKWKSCTPSEYRKCNLIPIAATV